jgi:hypothetical protein
MSFAAVRGSRTRSRILRLTKSLAQALTLGSIIRSLKLAIQNAKPGCDHKDSNFASRSRVGTSCPERGSKL